MRGGTQVQEAENRSLPDSLQTAESHFILFKRRRNSLILSSPAETLFEEEGWHALVDFGISWPNADLCFLSRTSLGPLSPFSIKITSLSAQEGSNTTNLE